MSEKDNKEKNSNINSKKPELNTEPVRSEVNPFFLLLTTLPQQTQEFVADLSNIFLEPDVYKSFRNDPESVEDLRSALDAQRLEGEDIENVFQFFNIPMKGETNEPK